MRDHYRDTVPLPVRKWTDDLDQFGGVQRPSEPLRTLAFVAKADYLRPIGPVDEDGIAKAAGGSTSDPLSLRPWRERGWWARFTSPLRDRGTRTHLLRWHP